MLLLPCSVFLLEPDDTATAAAPVDKYALSIGVCISIGRRPTKWAVVNFSLPAGRTGMSPYFNTHPYISACCMSGREPKSDGLRPTVMVLLLC